MFYDNLKKLIKKFPILWKFLFSIKTNLVNLSRLKDVLMMMILLHIWPEQTYRFSTRKLLPEKKNRFSKESRPVIPYDLLKSNNNKIPKMKEINVIGVGSSFDLENLKHMKGSNFLVTFWFPLKIDSNGEIVYKHVNDWDKGFSPDYKTDDDGFVDFFWKINNQKNSNTLKEFKEKNMTYAVSRSECVVPFKKNGYKVLSVGIYATDKEGNHYPHNEVWETKSYRDLFDDDDCKYIALVDKIYKHPLLPPHPDWVPVGSFLPYLCALSYFAEKINVYGWDFYLESSPEKMSYWKLFFNMYKYKPDVLRGKTQFESALINFYYGYQLSKLPNIKIHSHLGKLDKHKKLMKRIEKVLFN